MHKNTLQELLDHGIIDFETAERINAYYATKKTGDSKKMMLVYGILGAILAGLGIILIIAHNWEKLSDSLKLSLAFIPLIIAQGVSFFAYVKKNYSKPWLESAAAFLFLSLGGTLSMITQIYHIQGNVHEFILTWTLLALPISYVMNSSVASLLFIGFITYLGVLDYDNSGNGLYFSKYWLLLTLFLPFYLLVCLRKPKSQASVFLHWVLPISLLIMLGSLNLSSSIWNYTSYAFLCVFYVQISKQSFLALYPSFQNGYHFFGYAGLLFVLFISSFESFWNHVNYLNTNTISFDASFWISLILISLSFILYFIPDRQKSINPLIITPLLFFVFIILTIPAYIPSLFFNFYALGVGILTVKKGIENHKLGVMNLGISVISLLIICRFFDTNIPFVIKGILFLFVGISFFVANYYMAKKQSNHAS